MKISPLNLISSPLAVLNSLGLNLRVGLSSEDPSVMEHSEPYDVVLSVYSPEGLMEKQMRIGEIPINSRRFFDVSRITRELIPDLNHLAVIHRVPSKLFRQMSDLSDQIEVKKLPDYDLFRTVVEYSLPGGANGSVIYESPPGLNTRPSSNNLTFTSQIVLSEAVNTHIILINYSLNPSYKQIANYHFGIYTLDGKNVISDRVSVGPFGITVLDVSNRIPDNVINEMQDSEDGFSAFNFVGYSDDASIMSVVVNLAPSLGGVSVEHTHPPQTYLFPSDRYERSGVKKAAIAHWKSILTR